MSISQLTASSMSQQGMRQRRGAAAPQVPFCGVGLGVLGCCGCPHHAQQEAELHPRADASLWQEAAGANEEEALGPQCVSIGAEESRMM